MKIENNQIKISGRSDLLDGLRDLKAGARIAVKIAERQGQRHAVLDVGGGRVNAEFINGVPKSQSLFLVLEDKVKGTLYFRIEAGSAREDLIGELGKSTIFNLNDLNKSIHELQLHLREGIAGIFSLNKSILKYTGFTEENNKHNLLVNLLNKLLAKGADYKDLIFLTYLINPGINRHLNMFPVLLSGVLPDYKKIFEKDKITERITNFTAFLDEIFSENEKDEKAELIRTVLDLILNNPENEEGKKQYGETAFFDDEKFKQCRYIISENNIVLSLDLSYLGNIDILIRQDNGIYSVSFFCEKDESINMLKSEISMLESALLFENNMKVSAAHIVFFNSKKAVEKIIEIISAIKLNYLFDARA